MQNKDTARSRFGISWILEQLLFLYKLYACAHKHTWERSNSLCPEVQQVIFTLQVGKLKLKEKYCDLSDVTEH